MIVKRGSVCSSCDHRAWNNLLGLKIWVIFVGLAYTNHLPAWVSAPFSAKGDVMIPRSSGYCENSKKRCTKVVLFREVGAGPSTGQTNALPLEPPLLFSFPDTVLHFFPAWSKSAIPYLHLPSSKDYTCAQRVVYKMFSSVPRSHKHHVSVLLWLLCCLGLSSLHLHK
jgi:hypothetical protein